MGNVRFTAMTPKGGNYSTGSYNSSLPTGEMLKED